MTTPADPTGVADDRVELGVELLAHLEHEELSVADAFDRIEAITTDPAVQREVLREAERRGIVEREDGALRPTHSAFVRFDSQVIAREGEFECRRCGATIATGHFVEFDADEFGPFGSTCIRKVLGRE